MAAAWGSMCCIRCRGRRRVSSCRCKRRKILRDPRAGVAPNSAVRPRTPPPAPEGTTMPGNTIRLDRVLRAPPERIYRAFLDADALAKWLPPFGFTGKVHEMNAQAGGRYRMSFTNFTTGQTHSFAGEYLELSPHARIRYTGVFDDANLPGTMHTTVSLKQVPF